MLQTMEFFSAGRLDPFGHPSNAGKTISHPAFIMTRRPERDALAERVEALQEQMK